jgi:hypothetical protein
LGTLYPYDLLGREDDQDGTAPRAPVVGVDAVVGPLVSHELQGLVLAWGQPAIVPSGRIYGFGGGKG